MKTVAGKLVNFTLPFIHIRDNWINYVHLKKEICTYFDIAAENSSPKLVNVWSACVLPVHYILTGGWIGRICFK